MEGTTAAHLWSYLCPLLLQRSYYNKFAAMAPDDKLTLQISISWRSCIVHRFLALVYEYQGSAISYTGDAFVKILNHFMAFKTFISYPVQEFLPNIDMLNIAAKERLVKVETVVQWFGTRMSTEIACLESSHQSTVIETESPDLYGSYFSRKQWLKGKRGAWKKKKKRAQN